MRPCSVLGAWCLVRVRRAWCGACLAEAASATSASRRQVLGAVLIASVLVIRCSARDTGPAVLDPAHDACASCRMIVSTQRFASQVVAPYEDPRFFDDMGCLATFLATATLPATARVFVADHRTAQWVPAERAVYTRVDALTAPMGSHIIAHETAISRDVDRDAVPGIPTDAPTVFGGHVPSGG